MRGCYDFVRPSMIEDVFVLANDRVQRRLVVAVPRPAQIGAAGYLYD